MLGIASQREKAFGAGRVLRSLRDQSDAVGGWDQLDLLEQAWGDYNEAVRRLLVNEGSEGTTVQRVATLHWVLVQAVCLDAVLGRNADEGDSVDNREFLR